MEIILLPSAPRVRHRVHLGSRATFWLGALLLGAAAGLVYGGVRMGLALGAPPPPPVVAQRAEVPDRERARVEAAIRSAEQDINALVQRLGQMQAQLIRLDALGARLVSLAGLDEKEFDFSREPAQGGPEPSAEPGVPEPAEFLSSLRELAARIEDRAPKLRAVENLMLSRRLHEAVHPAGRPAASGWVSSFFGYRSDPITGKRAFHDGIDFAGRAGTEILAVAAGVVTWSGHRPGYGRLVEIDHGSGYVTRYAHNRKNLVAVGDVVRKGQPIASMGSSGRSTGPHVHFEVLLNGKAVNPLKYVRSAG